MAAQTEENVAVENEEAEEVEETEFLESVRENLTCIICKDFFVDAVTLTECAHSFCRFCLLKELRKNSKCPACQEAVAANWNEAFHFDENLQNIVYQTNPHFFWRQPQRIKRVRLSKTEQQLVRKNRLPEIAPWVCAPDEKISFVVEYVSAQRVLQKLDLASDSSLHQGEDKNTFKRYFRCSASVHLEHIKKILEMKLAASDSYLVYLVDENMYYVLEDENTLQDVVYLQHWDRESPLQLFFTLIRQPTEADEEPPPVLDAEEMPSFEAQQRARGELSSKEEGGENTDQMLSSAIDSTAPAVVPKIPKLCIQLPPSSLADGGKAPQSIIQTEHPKGERGARKEQSSSKRKSSPSKRNNKKKEGNKSRGSKKGATEEEAISATGEEKNDESPDSATPKDQNSTTEKAAAKPEKQKKPRQSKKDKSTEAKNSETTTEIVKSEETGPGNTEKAKNSTSGPTSTSIIPQLEREASDADEADLKGQSTAEQQERFFQQQQQELLRSKETTAAQQLQHFHQMMMAKKFAEQQQRLAAASSTASGVDGTPQQQPQQLKVPPVPSTPQQSALLKDSIDQHQQKQMLPGKEPQPMNKLPLIAPRVGSGAITSLSSSSSSALGQYQIPQQQQNNPQQKSSAASVGFPMTPADFQHQQAMMLMKNVSPLSPPNNANNINAVPIPPHHPTVLSNFIGGCFPPKSGAAIQNNNNSNHNNSITSTAVSTSTMATPILPKSHLQQNGGMATTMKSAAITNTTSSASGAGGAAQNRASGGASAGGMFAHPSTTVPSSAANGGIFSNMFTPPGMPNVHPGMATAFYQQLSNFMNMNQAAAAMMNPAAAAAAMGMNPAALAAMMGMGQAAGGAAGMPNLMSNSMSNPVPSMFDFAMFMQQFAGAANFFGGSPTMNTIGAFGVGAGGPSPASGGSGGQLQLQGQQQSQQGSGGGNRRKSTPSSSSASVSQNTSPAELAALQQQKQQQQKPTKTTPTKRKPRAPRDPNEPPKKRTSTMKQLPTMVTTHPPPMLLPNSLRSPPKTLGNSPPKGNTNNTSVATLLNQQHQYQTSLLQQQQQQNNGLSFPMRPSNSAATASSSNPQASSSSALFQQKPQQQQTQQFLTAGMPTKFSQSPSTEQIAAVAMLALQNNATVASN